MTRRVEAARRGLVLRPSIWGQARVLAATLVLLAAAVLFAGPGGAEEEVLRVGVTPGPHEEVMEVVRDLLREQGVRVEIVTFADYVTPNLVLAQGEIDANSFQHEPYLTRFAADRGLDLAVLAPTLNFPMGLYSRWYRSLDEVPPGATVAIPNDPTNGGRALLLLADAGLIELAPGVDLEATPLDVTANPAGSGLWSWMRPSCLVPLRMWPWPPSTPTTPSRQGSTRCGTPSTWKGSNPGSST